MSCQQNFRLRLTTPGAGNLVRRWGCLFLFAFPVACSSEGEVSGGEGGSAGGRSRDEAGQAGGSSPTLGSGGSGGSGDAASGGRAAGGGGGLGAVGSAGAGGGFAEGGSGQGGGPGADATTGCVGRGFSADLDPYPPHPTADQKSVQEMFDQTLAQGEVLSAPASAKRKEILAMYRAFHIDPSLDGGQFFSDQLKALRPQHWSPLTPKPLSDPYAQPFSVDAPVYHPVPCDSPRVELPRGTFPGAQLNCVHGFDGLGYATILSGSSTRSITAHDDGNRTFDTHVPQGDLGALLPGGGGDHQATFLDSMTQTFVDCIGSSLDNAGVHCSFEVQQKLPNLGDQGGTIASGMSTLAGLIRPGEITDANVPLRHAVYFGTNKMWKARVYPAMSGDAWLYTSQPDATYLGGVIPYGAVVQLDPQLDLAKYDLALPARRILEAMQTYGAYQMNTTGQSFNIYTSVDASELEKFAPVYNPSGGGIQDQIAHVLAEEKLYVVPPIIKRP